MAGRTPDDPDPARAADVAAAMRALDRAAFLPPDQRPHAHEDRPLPLGHGSTSSQPSTVAAMLRLLAVPAGARVLDVGAGSGWTTALLARLVGPAGEVLGVELEPAVAAWGAGNVAAAGMPWARLRPADPHVLGGPRPGGWDRVLVSAAAEALPRALVDQLAPGGVLVVPVGRTMHRVVRRPDGGVDVTTHGSYVFVPLR
ncbi:protein-L-isoaspartate O-methyltransferase family protein [Cellulomonas shaoxiangyii]|uniref:Protein-L-isoaspartate O-methyltransferase n=1 Tax=Cellulomonas shaoxiangyii TaxID=2566013 RepID=A0A4P7SL52_9CELL|nr:protein-L-isoaspartate O-methyltransferase [Cellulomonas shaoxiangyii]QCB94641.1 protein-L-isoaspartate O-methyltransferase [Cellulomonas shaoxiangyii]TGY81633.1 protein-L-isoaspartate O-methyltransferase [Cellulomonas shaoxiangyii]